MTEPIWTTPVVVSGNADDARLLSHVHPAGHVSPTPADRYDLVVLGGGTAGLVCAFGAAGLGARVALVERDLLGGDCLNTGCVPSKTLLAEAARAQRQTGEDRPPPEAFAKAMNAVRRVRANIATHDSVARLSDAGIDVFLGGGAFSARDAVTVSGLSLRFRAAVVATGARAAIPPIPGLRESNPLTNETIFSLTERPERLLVLGGGPIGCELAQAFARLGTRVTLFDVADRLLPTEDPDASAAVRESLTADGVDVRLGARVSAVSRNGEAIVVTANGTVEGDAILVAVGRTPNTSDANLGAAGIEAEASGVLVNARLQTSNPRVYAAGDVASDFKFTHAADAQARIVVRNALFPGSSSEAGLVIPWATYTDPEVAHVGPTVDDLAQRRDLTVYTVPFEDVDRARAEGDTRGFARMYVNPRGHIVAATVVGRGAGDLIGEASLAITHGLTPANLSATIHPYPTRGEVWRKLGDHAQRAKLTPVARTWLRRWFAFPWR